MRFLKIEAKNYRQYQNLDLDLVGHTNFSILQANIGVGKTTFTNAILWCLYGFEQSDKRILPEPLPNSAAVSDAGNGVIEVSVSLKIELDDESKSIATVRRTQKFTIAQGEVAPFADSVIRVTHLKDAGVGAAIIENGQNWVNLLLPRKLHPYFIFNGELSANYFAENSQQQIKETILRIARVDVLLRMKKHLQNVSDGIQGEMLKADPGNLESADKAVQDCRNSVDGISREIDGLEELLKQFDLDNADLRQRVEESGRVRKLIGELDELDYEHDLVKLQLKTEEDKLSLWVASNAPFYLGAQALEDMETMIEEAKSAGSFPPSFKPEPLLELISSGSCICGHDLKSDAKASQHIENLVNEYRIAGPRGVELQKIAVHLETFKERQADSQTEYDDHLKVIVSCRDDINSNRLRAEELKQEIGEAGDSQDVRIFEMLLAQLNARNDAATTLALKQAELLAENKLLTAAIAEYDRVLRKSSVTESLRNQFNFLKEAIEKIEEIKNRIVTGVLDRVGEELNSNFQEWHSKSKPETIELDENFKMRKVDEFGQSSSFSQGEFRLLYYSLCFAAREVSGFKLPLFVDSPWGNMDNTTRKKLAEVMGSGTDNRQTVILVLDSEYPVELAQIMAKSKPRNFTIGMNSGLKEKFSVITEVS